jgi:hypothetical protein
MDEGDGFRSVGPFKGRPTCITSGHRPMDPLLKDKIDFLIDDLIGNGFAEDMKIFLAIRSIDGFYCSPVGSGLIDIRDNEMADVINFDPTREIFIIRGNRKPDISAEIAWFAFETFPDINVLCIVPLKGCWPLEIPERSDERIEWEMDLMREWKDSKLMESHGFFMAGTKDLDEIFRLLLERFNNPSDHSEPPRSL